MPSNQLPDNFFKQIVESNWVAVTFADLNGILQYTNDSADTLYGYEKGELIGKSVDVLNGDDVKNTDEIISIIQQKGTWEGELTQKKKDGTHFLSYLTIWLIKNEYGQPMGLASNSKDISLEKNAQQKIQEGEETLRLLLDSLPIGIYILDEKGKPYYVNNFTKIFAEKNPSSKIEELDESDHWEIFKQNTDNPYPFEELPIAKALKGEKSSISDLDIVIKNHRYHVSVSGQPVFVNEKLKYAVSTFLDVSDILEKQNELIKKEEEITVLINSHNDYFFSVDPNYCLIRYNDGFKNRIEPSRPGYLKRGASVVSLLPESELEVTLSFYKRAFNGETVVDEREYHFPNGSQVMETRYTPIYRGDNIFAVSVFSQDITQRKQRELQLKEALQSIAQKESEISSIINNTEAMILSIDRAYNIIEHNESLKKTLSQSFPVDQLKGQSVFKYMNPNSHEYSKKLYDRAFAGETIVDEHAYETTNGIFEFETRYNPIVTSEGIAAISIFSQNITTRKENQRKLKQALTEKELLLNEIHHRVKNNLAIISSLLQLEELKSSNREIKDILRSSQNRIKSTALVHQFLYQNDSIAKIKFKEYVEEFIAQIEQSFASERKINIEIKGNDFHLDIEQAIPCGLILNEMFTNALKHAFPPNIQSPKITISLNCDDEGNIELVFSDNGVGLVEPSPSSNTLGLTVIKTLVKQLKGNLEIRVENGTSFIISFQI